MAVVQKRQVKFAVAVNILSSSRRERYSCGTAAESANLHPSPVLLLALTVHCFQGI